MDNVDLSEIRKFEALAARWWDPNSEFKPLHEINPLRMNYISRHINLAELNVLDVGCGGGQNSVEIALAVGSSGGVVGVDVPAAVVAAEPQSARHSAFFALPFVNLAGGVGVDRHLVLRRRADEYNGDGPVEITTRLAKQGETLKTLDGQDHDLRPNNILVTHRDGKPLVKIIDFGIAKSTEQKLAAE